jgi:transcriptional regulator with XRE-family HTH domain
MTSTIFAERFTLLRRRVAATQKDFAELFTRRTGLPLSQQKVSAWESGVNTPDAVELAHLCHIFEVAADWLIGLVDNEQGLRPGLFVIDLAKIEHQKPGDDWGWLLPPRCRYATKAETASLLASYPNKGKRSKK